MTKTALVVATIAGLAGGPTAFGNCLTEPVPPAVAACPACTTPVPLVEATAEFAVYRFLEADVPKRINCYRLEAPSYQGWRGELTPLGGTIWLEYRYEYDLSEPVHAFRLHLGRVQPTPLSLWLDGDRNTLSPWLYVSTTDLLGSTSFTIAQFDLNGFYYNSGTLVVADPSDQGLLTPCDVGSCIAKARFQPVWLRFDASGDRATAVLDKGDERRVLFTQMVDFELAPPSVSELRTHSYYVGPPGPADRDRDGIVDDIDNCIDVYNPGQHDVDGDGYGQICDADLTNNRLVNEVDVNLLRNAFFSGQSLYDLDMDGRVNFADLGITKDYFYRRPGPSARTPFDSF